MTREELESIAEIVADVIRTRQNFDVLNWTYNTVEACLAFLAAVQKRMEPQQDAFPQAHRLALELECLLLDTKDMVVVSKWWDSAHDALEQWRQFCSASFAAPQKAGNATEGSVDACPAAAGAAPIPADVEQMVERLRDYINECDDIGMRLEAADLLERQAAEIERLTKERDMWRDTDLRDASRIDELAAEIERLRQAAATK